MPTAHTVETVNLLTGHALALGCPGLLFLHAEPTPDLLDYLDLVRRRNSPLLPDAVAEFQGRPLLYLVNGAALDRPAILKLQQLLANRGDHACLGVATPGSLDVYPINLDADQLAEANFITIQLKKEGAAGFFQSLATRTFELDGQPKEADYVYDSIHQLLAEASKELAGTADAPGPLPGLEVLSTTGRALFFRFLLDRRIVRDEERTEICPSAESLRDAFSSANAAAETSCWLDETFNGDLLPLGQHVVPEPKQSDRLRAYGAYFKKAGDKTAGRIFLHLQAILKGWQHAGGGAFQTKLDWDQFDFAHIPIGVLSQVYESFSHQWDEDLARTTSVHYTPRHIAKFMVDEAFANLPSTAGASVLDPACGAGVFLVLAFRRLVAEYWKEHGARPNTRAIQHILYQQIRGFEISESALRLAALALYITAIEVNDSPRPPASLKFPRPLRNEVLFDFGQHHDAIKHRFGLGSLGPDVPSSFNGVFDVVVTNPPWTRLRSTATGPVAKAVERERIAAANKTFTEISQRALRARSLTKLASSYENPDNNPDLPLLWRATEWAKPNGILAFALPARILLKQSPAGRKAREALLGGLALTGILNGSDLEETRVWPNMKIPFMVLFSRNATPGPDHCFHFVTPVRENNLSSVGKFRIDYKSAQTVRNQAVIDQPWLLKALAVGTVLDVDVIDKLSGKSVGEIWTDRELASGQGYNLSPGLKQSPAEHLVSLPDFERPEVGFQIPANLPTWFERHHGRKTAHMPRAERVFRAPLLIVNQGKWESRTEPKAFLSMGLPMAFSQSNYGFSGEGAADPELLLSMLYLAVHSQLFNHFCLMRSSRLGANFRTIVLEDLETFPLPDAKHLSPTVRLQVSELAVALQVQPNKPWDEIDQLVFDLYGLDEHDATVVRDTVAFCGPYRSVRQNAEQPISSGDQQIFCQYLENMLLPLFRLTGESIHVQSVPYQPGFRIAAWQFVSITKHPEPLKITRSLLTRLMEEANSTGASRVTLRTPKGLLIGILNQRRFWTRSRARLCSLYIEEHHLDAFDG